MEIKTLENDTGKVVRVLLVDDEESFRNAIARRLERRNMVVSQAPDGTSCLEYLGANEADVVLLDMNMPGMSGIDTFKAINKYHPGLQVIFLTGNAGITEGVEGIKAGAFDYLSKPIEIDHLAGKIRQAWELKRLEAAREQDKIFRRRLEKRMIHTQRLASLGTMSTGIAHEINNPLAIIKESAGFMRMVLEGAGQIPEKEMLFKGLDKIEKSVDRARRITHQLLGYVRKHGHELTPVDIRQLTEDTVVLIKQKTQAKKVSVQWDIAPKEPMLMYTDPFQVRQVLINLLENAVDAVETGGQIRLSLTRKDQSVCLQVRDNGSGIAPENMAKIFDPFFTTKPNVSENESGTGLGLFVAHKIMSGLSGSIHVESEPGHGATFTICLPEWHSD
ncbi:MAG: response regulator [Desulfobacter sp.]|uniref:hybrid sensor histidine kinase/response regulator n=1 Tax=Desulfobacter sp. TaxID=2294 RepID=UPI001B797647|nr:response regulator [Desulfobacter sp.]MBP8828114.1 response regulator [Desulfobacter sp.]MBP9598107.1 response regulator [Desulfobacter sp.]